MRRNHRWTPQEDRLLLDTIQRLTPTRQSYLGTELGVLAWWRSVAAELAVAGGPEVSARSCESRSSTLRKMREDELEQHLTVVEPELADEPAPPLAQEGTTDNQPIGMESAGAVLLLREMLKELRQMRALLARGGSRVSQQALEL